MHTHSLFVFIPLPAPSCPRDRGLNKLRILICNNHKWFPLRLFRHFEAVWSVNVVSAVPYSSFSYCLMAAFIAVSCGHCKCTYSDVQSATPQKLIWRLSLMTDRGPLESSLWWHSIESITSVIWCVLLRVFDSSQWEVSGCRLFFYTVKLTYSRYLSIDVF